jgi:hypothetical protein
MLNKRLTVVVCLLSLATCAGAERWWAPVKDEVYLQEAGYQIKTESRVWAVGVLDGRAYAGFGEGVQRVTEDNRGLEPVEGAPEEQVQRMRSAAGALWVITAKGLHRLAGGQWTRIAEDEFVDVCEHMGGVVVASPRSLFRVEGDNLVPIPGAVETPGPMRAIASYAETIYCLGYDRVFLFDGQQYDHKNVIDLGTLPSKDLRDILAFGSRLLVGTHAGLGVIRGTAATAVLGADGLPFEETTGLARGFAGDYWVATTKGAIRAVDGEYQYFTGARWLPDDSVNAIACGPHTAYIATNGGVGVIDYEPYTLLKKAAYYERHLEEWGQKRMAFVHKLEWDAGKGQWIREVSDNDVGWSTHYWASQAFKYAATKDEQARKNAVEGFNCLKWSEEITSIPGFPARSIWAVGETGHQAEGGSGGYAAEWHPTADGLWEWKGDTSSDETDAQFYYASVFYELAANEKEKALVREHVGRIASHIVDHGWTLCDVDGKPTVWGRWDPEYFAGKGVYARGLNGMEILNYMRTAHALTGDAKYAAALQQLLDMDYTSEVLRQKLTFPPQAVFHSDDRLAFYTYYTLLQYETDPALRSLYRRSLERSFEIERIENIPWFNFIYGELTGNDCEAGQAVKHLREWPLDLIKHPFDFSHRRDLYPLPGYLPYAGVKRAFSPRERGPGRWTNNMGEIKGGGREVEDPSGWLDAYWMGRYYGFILPPETDDPALTTVPPGTPGRYAPLYDGPPMPWVLGE